MTPLNSSDARAEVDCAVVIPCFNGVTRGFVFRAVDSVLAQTVPPRQFFVVDDGSRDGTAEALRSRYPGLEVLSKPNGGLPDARNFALKHVTSSYVCFLDDDDEWVPEKLATQSAYLDAYPEVGLVFSGVEFIDANGAKLGEAMPNDIGLAYPGLLLGNNVLPPSAVMFRRTLIDAAGPFDATLRQGEDYEYFVRCSKHGRLAVQEKALVRYRQHGAQMSSSLVHIDDVTLAILKKHAAADYPQSVDQFVRFFCYGAVVRALTRRDWATARRYLKASGDRLHVGEFLLRLVGVLLHPLRPAKLAWRRYEVRRVLARVAAVGGS